jgi:hypothetical protein
MTSRSRIPSPAIAISIVALVVAVGGGAFAVASSNSRQTTKIVTKVVRRLAPKLSVKHAKSADTAALATALPDGSVTTARLADGSVTSAKILDGAIATRDIAGVDVTTAIDLASVPGVSCSSADLPVGGAQPGDVVLASFVGSTPPPADLVIEPQKVTKADSVRFKICNVGAVGSSATAGVGIRVLALR